MGAIARWAVCFLVAVTGVVPVSARGEEPTLEDCAVEADASIGSEGSVRGRARSADDDPNTIVGRGEFVHRTADGRRLIAFVDLLRCRRNGGWVADTFGPVVQTGVGAGSFGCPPGRHGFGEGCRFVITMRDEGTFDTYSFRLIDQNDEILYATAGPVTQGNILITRR